jgi:RHS repeat-associated protein
VVHTRPNPVPNSSTVSIMIDGDQQDEHLVRVADGRFQHMQQDRTGSVFLVSDGAGTVLEQYAYTAYGERTIENQDGFPVLETAINNDIGFQGQRHDPVTGLIEMRNRWLRPDLGRFLSGDPLGYSAGSNRYAFVEGAPLRWTDPFGLAPREPAQSSSLGSELFSEVLRAWLPAHTGPYIKQPGLTGNAYLDFIRRQDAATAQQWRNAAGEIQKFEVMQAVGGMPMASSPARVAAPMLRPAMAAAEEGAETGARALAPVIEAEAGGAKWLLRDAFGSAIPKGDYVPAGAVFGQLTEHTCTAAACRAVASDFGVQLSEEALAAGLNTTAEGAFIHGVPEALGNLGVEGGRFAKDLTLQGLEQGLQGGRPAIVGVRIPGVGSHALVVDAVRGGIVYIRDSLPGLVGRAYTINVQDFLQVWKGTAVFF